MVLTGKTVRSKFGFKLRGRRDSDGELVIDMESTSNRDSESRWLTRFSSSA